MDRKELLEKKGRLVQEARQIMDDAQKDGRQSMSKEEETKFLTIHADIEELTKTVALLDKQADAERAINDPGVRKSGPNMLDPDLLKGNSSLSRGLRDQDEAIRGWFMEGAPSSDKISDATRESYRKAAQRVGLNIGSKTLTFRLPANPLTGKRSEDFERWDQLRQEERANFGPQSSTSAGGFSIQDAAMREVEVALLSYGAMRRAGCTVIRTDTGGPLPIPTVNDTTNAGHLVTEGTTIVTTDLTLAQTVLNAWKYTSDKVLVSVELMQDNSINLPQLLGRLLGERIGRVVNTDFTTGGGSTKPNGIVNGATFFQATTGNSTTITLTNLLTLYHNVDPAYRDNSKWMFHDTTLRALKLLTDSQGRPLWLPGLVDRAPDTLLGSPYVINQDVSAMTSTGKSLLFGDFSKYWIRDVRDITLLRLDERFAEFLQVAFLAFMRTDGALLDAGTHPVRGYQNATA